MKVVRFDYTVLVVSDLDRSLDFYIDVLGIPLGHRSGGYAQLRTGPTRLALYTREAMQETLGNAISAPDPRAPSFELGFIVDDVDAVYADFVQRGWDPVLVAHSADPIFRVRDRVALRHPSRVAARREGASGSGQQHATNARV